MYKAKFKVVGVTPIVFSKYVDKTTGEAVPKKGEKDNSPEYTKRTAHLKAHVNEKGNVFIPSCAILDCVCAMAKKAGDKFKGNQTYGKILETGLECEDDIDLGVKLNNTERHEGFFRVNKAKDDRVFKSFPMVSNWQGDVELTVDDDAIPAKMLEEYLNLAGRRIGLGSFRKQNRGSMGKFVIENFKTVVA